MDFLLLEGFISDLRSMGEFIDLKFRGLEG